MILLAGMTASLVAASGNIINDFFDIEIDKINRPLRPLPAGILSKREALVFYFILLTVSLIFSIYISTEAFIIVLSTSVLLFLYSLKLKGRPLIGNVIVALCTALAFIFGGIVVGNIEASIVPAAFAFLINLIRELLKDIEDIEGDRKNNQLTFAVKYGEDRSKHFIILLTIILILSTFYPFISQLYNIEYFVLVLFLVDLPLIIFARSIFSRSVKEQAARLSLSLKLIMVFGLFAIFIGMV
jgi:geranylgeranylglycerol-phosphate geranylgeranyltransferase